MGSSGSVFTLVVSESVNSCRFLAGPTIVLSYDTGSGVGCPWIYFCCCGSLVIEGLERSLYSPWLLAYPEGGLYLSSETDSCACFGDPPGSVGFIEYLVFGFSWKIVTSTRKQDSCPGVIWSPLAVLVPHFFRSLLGKNTLVSFPLASRQDPDPRIPDKGTLRVPDKGTLRVPVRRNLEFGPWNRAPFQEMENFRLRRTFHISEYGRV
ncbi:hypothetical protein F2Q70_00020309 [Brassica cretica]|uniref:Uncharacterized protein n=1 Tax=Brassica cretica TaxID=69181 RepID=A0A8S9GJ26_BRACR|nr:hypothetical protein F2Q70_00020309 [Brassica cretica]